MGFHRCEYMTREEAEKLNLRNKDVVYSSGDVTLCFSSGNSWVMPDMAKLYVEIGWKPPQDFINDVMNSKLVESNDDPTCGTRARPMAIGYLKPATDPLPKPFAINPDLPAGFLQKMEGLMKEAEDMGYRGQTRSGRAQTNSGRAQTKGFKP
ncbi:MAG: hypothetical protein ACAH80_01315 [Alphaproteobacteria bacterium]